LPTPAGSNDPAGEVGTVPERKLALAVAHLQRAVIPDLGGYTQIIRFGVGPGMCWRTAKPRTVKTYLLDKHSATSPCGLCRSTV